MRVHLAIALLAIPALAVAEPAPAKRVAINAVEPMRDDDASLHVSRTAPEAAPHAIYLELGGHAGRWGAGYDWKFHPRFAVGGAASYDVFDGDRIATVVPYVAAYPLVRGHSSAFVQLGASLQRRTTPSPVPEWDGLTTNELGAQLCAGYEYRNHVLIRAYAMARQSDHVLPWFGASFGWTL